MATSTSPYQSLDNTNDEIRLLQILPDLHPLDNRIQCQLITYSINENPEYEAISYTWGSPSEEK